MAKKPSSERKKKSPTTKDPAKVKEVKVAALGSDIKPEQTKTGLKMKLASLAKARRSVAALSLLILAVALSSWLYHSSTKSPIPDSISHAAHFSIYYPKDVKIDRRSIQLSDNANLLSYVIHYKGTLMYVTIQGRPENFDFSSLNKQITESTEFLTDNGSATVGKLSGRRVGSLVSSDSWILVSSTLNTPASDVVDVMKKLVRG